MGLFNTLPEMLQSSVAQLITSSTTASASVGTYQVDTSAGDVTIILPHFNKMWTIKKITTDSNKLIIIPESGLIENKANYSTTSTTRPSYNVRDDGANFWLSMGFNESEASRETNTSVGDPRLRVNKTTAMTLTTTPQTINFNGTSPYNLNTFTVLPGQTNPSVWYDSTTQLFNFTSNNDKNYNLYLTTSITSNQLLSTLNLTSASLRMRLYIPSPTPVTFPGPDVGGYVDLGAVNLTGQRNDYQPVAFFANALIRQYGFQIQLHLSNSVLGTVSLNGADVNLFPV